MAALLAATIAVPAGAWFAGITALPLAFIGAGDRPGVLAGIVP